ncbi:MAG: hypothetical protein OXT71_09625 [Acidobacteriota bacterium]|nr:hypothetical protein [Acidobacteriota bacterium]
MTTAQASPNISAISRKAPTTEHTSADTLTWLLTFTEPMTSVDRTDFVVSGTTARLVMSPFALDEEGCSVRWDATLSGGDLADLNGTVTLTPAAFPHDDMPCQPGSNTPCIGGCLGDGESMTHPGPRGRNDNTFVVSNVLSAPEGVDTAGGPCEGDTRVGTLEIHLYNRDGDEPMVYETTGDSPGDGLDENGMLAPGQTYTVSVAELGGEDRAFVGYGWIVGNFDGIAGTRTIINAGQAVTVHGDLTPELSHHGAGMKPIPRLE